jgi:hypothetical protein
MTEGMNDLEKKIGKVPHFLKTGRNRSRSPCDDPET